MAQVELSERQAREFARIICLDIEVYVQMHPEEFNQFLNEHGNNGGDE